MASIELVLKVVKVLKQAKLQVGTVSGNPKFDPIHLVKITLKLAKSTEKRKTLIISEVDQPGYTKSKLS